MKTRTGEPFSTVRTEGGLLPSDILDRIAKRDEDLPGLSLETYHLDKGERFEEIVTRAWNRLTAAWRRFQSERDKLPESDRGTTLTRERWLLPLFRGLDYGRLQPARAIEIEGKSYPISHVWHHVPIHLVSCRLQLDQRTEGVRGAARTTPHGLVQEFLNRSEAHLWGFVSNGLRLRVLRDNASLTRQAYLEFDLEAMMEGGVYPDFKLLWFLLHQSRIEAEQPEECWLERWTTVAREEGTRALEGLRAGVEEAIKALGAGFLAHPANQELREKLRSGALSKEDYFRQLLRLVYRLLFLFVAEDRGLLLDPDAEPAAADCYGRFYSTRRLRKLAEKQRGGKHPDLYRGLRVVMERLGCDEGCPPLGLPPLGSFLWSREAIADLRECDLANSDLLDTVRALAFTRHDRLLRTVDYKNLGSEELGSVYESLLELNPDLNTDAATFELVTRAGHERKTTGSYYTPSSLVQCLLDSAVDPVLDEAARKPRPEEAILDLKVCDPACGSGHFLIGAAHRIARRLAQVRSGDEEPSPETTREALRSVVGRCLFGVDLNPMAVELCKVSLWMEAMVPGKPLSFLEHHIVRGNSLLGTTPALMAQGIPDDAFKPIEGDDREVAKDWRRRNREERKGRLTSLFYEIAAEQAADYEALTDDVVELERLPDDTIGAVHDKAAGYRELTGKPEYRHARLVADAWCAAFVWKKTRSSPLPMTQDMFRRLAADETSVPRDVRREIARLAGSYGFFQWHLAFPNVFRTGEESETGEHEATGWSGGFDVVLGNPPWERIKLQEKEWFAARHPEIASAPTAAVRGRLIKGLEKDDPALYRAFHEARRQAEGESHLVRHSGRYPLCGRGDINTYTIFAETKRLLISSTGRVGTIVPSGIATDDTTKYFFQDLMNSRSLVRLYDFENRAGLFPAVDSRMKFCLLTLTGAARPAKGGAEFVFFAHRVEDLDDEERRFTLSAEEIARVNPNTRTCPVYRTRRDAEITKGIYRRVPVLIKEGPPEENPWGVSFMQGLFNMTSASHLFRTREELEAEGWTLEGNIFRRGEERYLPLYEGRLGHQYNHRFAVQPAGHLRRSTPESWQEPSFVVETHYWVARSEVSRRLQRRKTESDTGLLAHRRVSRNTDDRTVIACILPWGAASYGWILSMGPSAHRLLTLLAAYNSYAFDYLMRTALSQPSIPQSTFAQVACPLPKTIEESYPGFVQRRTVELTYTSWDLAPFAQDCGYEGPPFRWDGERRFLLRCELDAAFFHLYGIARDDADYIMETFPIVKRKDLKKHGDYRTKLVILDIYDRMMQAMESGKPYQTLLDPPPADPSLRHPAERVSERS